MELKLTKAYKSHSDERIIAYGWVDEDTSKKGISPKRDFIEWIEKRGGRAYISKQGKKIYYSVRVMPSGERIIQPSSEGSWLNDSPQITTAVLA